MDKNNKQEDLSWKVLHSEYLFRCPWLTVRRDAVELPNGHTIPDYYVLEYPDWVNTIALTDDDQFVMVRQYRHGLRYTGYELCAGVCEKGETPEQAARRELLEETGFGGGTWQSLMDISGNTSTTNNLTHCFLATGVRCLQQPHLDYSEDLRTTLLSRQEVFRLLQSGHFKQSLMAAPLWKYFATCGPLPE